MKKLFKKKKVIIVLLLVILVGGYFGYKTLFKKESETHYTLATVKKGTIVVSVSGSGQVSALDQIDIKPKISGEITGLYLNKDEVVKAGQVLAILDFESAQRAVNEAEVALKQAETKLEELLSSPDAQPLLQAENALAQAERDLEKAKRNYENIEIDAEKTLATTFEDGYNQVSTSFFKLSDYMKNLKEVLGTDQSAQAYISGYRLILGRNSPFIEQVLADYEVALNLFNQNFAFFRTVSPNDDRDIIYQLISDTLETTRAISRAQESVRHMYDAAVLDGSYKQFNVASQIDKMKPKIESDLSSIFSLISTLQKTIDTIDDTLENTPDKIKDAELAFKSAQEKFEERKDALEKLKAGPDPLDIKNQQNIVVQRKAALITAQENLANCYIRAPFDGVIAKKGNVKKGDAVSASTILATLITEQKIAELNLNEIDAAKVKVGQKATLTFDALPDVTATGKVIEIDTVGTVSQGVVSYGLKIALDIDDERIKPAMSVTADIIAEAKTNVLVLPNSAVKFQGGAYYVELLEVPEQTKQQLLASMVGATLPVQPKIQNIEIGISNDTSTEVLSNLKEGDIVVAASISSAQSIQTQRTQQFQIPGMGTQIRTR